MVYGTLPASRVQGEVEIVRSVHDGCGVLVRKGQWAESHTGSCSGYRLVRKSSSPDL
jgi:hypothetical protein